MPTTKKKKYNVSRTRQTKKVTEGKKLETKDKRFIATLVVAKNYTEKIDTDYEKYKNKPEFKRVTNANPTLFIVNMIFHDCHKKSFFNEICDKKNKELADVLTYCFKLATIVKTKKIAEQYPIVAQLSKHGFNTIYDIILENVDSFFLVAFVSHLVSEKVIKNPNEFITFLSKNKLYEMLRDKLVIRGLQLVDLFTRIKRYQ